MSSIWKKHTKHNQIEDEKKLFHSIFGPDNGVVITSRTFQSDWCYSYTWSLCCKHLLMYDKPFLWLHEKSWVAAITYGLFSAKFRPKSPKIWIWRQKKTIFIFFEEFRLRKVGILIKVIPVSITFDRIWKEWNRPMLSHAPTVSDSPQNIYLRSSHT